MAFGKFETAEKLFEAYQNLEKDYTRKSQELSELRKNSAQLNTNNMSQLSSSNNNLDNVSQLSSCDAQLSSGFGTIQEQDAAVDSKTFDVTKSEQTETEHVMDDASLPVDLHAEESEEKREEEEETAKQPETGAPVPVWQNPMWSVTVKEFFEGHPIAASVEKEVLGELAADRSLHALPDALARAAERVVGREILNGSSKNLADAIAAIESVRDRVLTGFSKELAERHAAPPQIGSGAGTFVATGKRAYRSIREASDDLLKRL